jgi:transcriptional regulator with XRE-family HTH domain
MTEFGTAIKEIRKQKKITQKYLCADICSQSVLSRIENNEEIPNIIVFEGLCRRLGVSTEEILHFKGEDVNLIRRFFSESVYLYRHREFSSLLNYLNESAVYRTLHLDTDIQKFHFLRGAAHYYAENNLEAAFKELTNALEITFHNNKKYLSNCEVLIFSMLGIVNFRLGKTDIAKSLLEKSIAYIEETDAIQDNVDFILCYYNYSVFLFETNALIESGNFIEQGVKFARRNQSTYFLDDLFLLRARIDENIGLTEQAREFRKLAEEVLRIRQTIIN